MRHSTPSILAAGEALPVVGDMGTGIYISLFLVLLAGLIISMVMLRSEVFGRVTAVSGILASGLGLAYYPALVFAPALIWIPPAFPTPPPRPPSNQRSRPCTRLDPV